MKSLLWTVGGCALLALVAAYPGAQEKSAAGKAGSPDSDAKARPSSPALVPAAAESEETTDGNQKPAREKQNRGEDNAPATVKIFRLRRADASESRQLLREMYRSEFQIAADVRTNTLVVRGTPEILAMIEAVLINLDDIESADKPQVNRALNRRAVGGDTAERPPTGWGTASEDRLPSLPTADDPEVKGAKQDFRRLDQKAAELARQYRQAQEAGAAKGASSPDDPALVKLKAELEETVQAAFDERQKVQSYEVDRLRQRLAQIESRLRMRGRAQKEIVRQRVEELLHPEREWESAGEADRSPAASGKGPDNRSPKQSPPTDDDRAASLREPRGSRPRTSGEASTLERAPDSAAPSSADVIGNPRKEVLDAESAATAARGAIAAAEKSRDFSQTDLKRTQQAYEKGAISDKALRTIERQASDDDARLEKAKLELQQAERRSKLARENLGSRMKLLELDIVDAKLQIEHLSAEEARARRLLESKAMSQAVYDESKLALQRAKLQLSRLTELMELYTKPIPGTERMPALDGKKGPPDSRSKLEHDETSPPRP